MNQQITLAWQHYRYFPYEKCLAEREVETLLNAKPTPVTNGLLVNLSTFPTRLLDRLTYFRAAQLNGTLSLEPQQARLEASAMMKRTTRPQRTDILLTRQSTRYSAHGLHEYRGKFNPQIVRAALNLLGVCEGARVLDPFCGSGTALLECAHLGLDAVGVDRNPLGVFVSNTKLKALRVPPKELVSQPELLAKRLLAKASDLNFERAFCQKDHGSLRPKDPVTLPNREYLERWFSPSVLAQLEAITAEIERLEHPVIRDVARVVLSDSLREVSFQDPADLRIRRRKNPKANYPAIPLFVNALRQRTSLIVRARSVLGRVNGSQIALLGDSRKHVGDIVPRALQIEAQFDCLLTSPPYATALPYIDTQRLSIAFLGLAAYEDIRALEGNLIGNREISVRERRTEELEIQRSSTESLPAEVAALCRRAYTLATTSQDGFRRRNVPALLFRYFRDMRLVFSQALGLVKPGGAFALVVGPNRTTLAGETITINTPALLALVAESVGWRRKEVIALDAYPRFDLHRKNSITTEALIILQK